MAPAIHGVNNYLNRIYLSNYSLTIQIIIINFLTAFLGLIFLFIFNYFLMSSDENTKLRIKNIEEDLNQITNYLSDQAIIRIPQFNEENCNDIQLNKDQCGNMIMSNPQLDPTSTQRYLFDNFLNKNIIIKVFDDSWIKFVDTEDIYESTDVLEIDIEKTSKSPNLYAQYKDLYLKNFNVLKKFFEKKNLGDKIEKQPGDIFLVKETIQKKSKISYIYEDTLNNVILAVSSPILKKDNIFGVVIVSGILNQERNESALISLNLINLFIVIIFIMFFLSLLFSQSIISPIKILSKIVRSERDKSNKSYKENIYPNRQDEIGVLSDDIKGMFYDLKKRITEIESFAADVSHELKNPLASLQSSSELLIADKIPNEKKTLLLKNMEKDIQRINILISDISSYTLTQVEIEDELFYRFEIVEFIKELTKSYSSNSKNIRIIFEYEKGPLFIYANQNKLGQVFNNLIDNSLSYSPKNSEILIKLKSEDNRAVIFVCDQGIGIENNLRDKIFERFYTDRIDNKDKHSGLGLSIAKKIVENFEGKLELSDVNFKQYYGACFKIDLPLKEQ